jgi:predicted O-methyltransferase YrrM
MFKFSKMKKNLVDSEPIKNLSDTELLEINKAKCSWLNAYYGNIDTLARLISAKNLLEIGVAYGYHAEHLLRNLPTIKYTGIDPYLGDYDLNDAFSRDVSELFNDTSQNSMDRLYVSVSKNLTENYPKRAEILRVKSLDVNLSQQYSLIFLDGDHRYEIVAQELKKFFPLVHKGGILAGDDYTWPGVKKAVDEFLTSNQLEIHFLSKEIEGHPTYFFVKP